MNRRQIGIVVGVMCLAGPAQAGVEVYLLGTDAPPDVIGGLPFTAFAPDQQSAFADVDGAALDGSSPPSGVLVSFISPMNHQVVGEGWATWSHGYTGDVYFSNFFSGWTLNLPNQPVGFRFYLQPNSFDEAPFEITAVTTGGSALHLNEMIRGPFGAEGFAFVAGGGDTLASIHISTTIGGGGFAVGEFGIAMVPTPATLALFGLAPLARRRRR